MIICICGAPATGKSTLGPVLNAALTLLERRGDSAEDQSLWVDRFLQSYRHVEFERQARKLLHEVLGRMASVDPADAPLLEGLAALPSSVFGCAEVDDCPGYRDERGNLDREMTCRANAWACSFILRRVRRVLIPGTGLQLHRLGPLLSCLGDAAFKIVVPFIELEGFFSNSLTKALEVRTTRGRDACRFVPAPTMRELFEKQRQSLSAGGLWSRFQGLHTANELSRALLRQVDERAEPERALLLQEIKAVGSLLSASAAEGSEI